jgi:hypothetical protein
MAMATRGADGIYYTETTKARTSYVQPTEAPDRSDSEASAQALSDIIGEAIAQTTAPLKRRVKELELQLAETRGALDVLRGRGIPGTLNIRGTYDSRSTYNRLDVCAFNGASWVAKRDGPGPCPGDDWQLLSAPGKRGVQGLRGATGPAGTLTFQGTSFDRQGMQIRTNVGSIQLIKNVTVDPQDFSLKFTAADDSTLTINLLPLFEAYY